MRPDGTCTSSEAVLESQNPSPMDPNSTASEKPAPRVKARRVGRGRGRDSESQAPAGGQAGQAFCELSSVLQKGKPENKYITKQRWNDLPERKRITDLHRWFSTTRSSAERWSKQGQIRQRQKLRHMQPRPQLLRISRLNWTESLPSKMPLKKKTHSR